MEVIEGIVLKQMNYKESSKIIYVYTCEGLLSVLVHGSNKLKSPYLNLVRVFSHVRLHVSGKELKTLRDGQVINYFSEISQDISKYTYSSHLTELIYYFSHHDHDHKKLYLFLLKILNIIIDQSNYEIYIMMAELKLLYLLGVQPMLRHCVYCESKLNLTFSIKDGGMLCSEHSERSVYKHSTINLLMILYYYNLEDNHPIKYSKEDLIDLRGLIDRYYEYHLNYRSRSRKSLIDLLGY